MARYKRFSNVFNRKTTQWYPQPHQPLLILHTYILIYLYTFILSDDLSIVMPSRVFHYDTCNATTLMYILTRVTPHTWLHLITNVTPHMPTSACGLMLLTHAYPRLVPNGTYLSPSSTMSSACTQLDHIPYTMCKMILTPPPNLMLVPESSTWKTSHAHPLACRNDV